MWNNADRFHLRFNSGNFSGLGDREVCFHSVPNCNGSGNNGVTVGEAPVAGTFTLATAASGTLILTDFAAGWQATGPWANGSNSGAGVITAVPEPTTWAMMLVGFGMLGAAMRYRRKSTAVSFA